MAVPGLALGQQMVLDRLHRAHVQAAGGLDSHDHLGVGRDLPGQDHLLQIAAGEFAARVCTLGARMS